MITEIDKRNTLIKFSTAIALVTLDTVEEMETMQPAHVLRTILQQYNMIKDEEKVVECPDYSLGRKIQELFEKTARMTARVLWDSRVRPVTEITNTWLCSYNEVLQAILPGDAKAHEEVLTHLMKILDEATLLNPFPGLGTPNLPTFSRN